MFRSYSFEKIDNFRDLGGFECPYGMTSYGVIYRSATPCDATKSDVEKVARLGIKTIIDLRDPGSKEKKPSPFKGDARFSLIELEVNGNGRIPVDHEDSIASYMEMVEDPYAARKIIQAILSSDKPCLIHCNAGKDRTGVFCSLILLAAGVRFEDINADYMASFPYLYEATKKIRAEHPDFPEVCLTPDIFMLRDFFVAFEEKYGDLVGYFEAIGLSEEDCDAFKNLLGKQEKSCGAVVFQNGKVLIEHMKKGHYSLPKGHVEKGDKNEVATAKREIFEETGLKVYVDSSFRQKTVYSPKPGVIKQIIWFVAEVTKGKPKPQESEVRDIYFLMPEDALTALSYDSDRKLLIEACRHRYP